MKSGGAFYYNILYYNARVSTILQLNLKNVFAGVFTVFTLYMARVYLHRITVRQMFLNCYHGSNELKKIITFRTF